MQDPEKYGKSLFSKIKKLIDELLENFGEKKLHKLRVEIKKLRAFSYLIETYNNKIDEHFRKQLKKVFRKNGRIRDLQVLLSTIQEFDFSDDSKDEFVSLLETQMERYQAEFKERIKDSGEKKFHDLKTESVKAIKETDLSNPLSYFDLLIERIFTKIQRHDLREQEYHLLRMDLKELKYNLKLLDEEDKKMVSRLPDEVEIDRLEVMLGEWHDQVTLSGLVEGFANREQLSDTTLDQLKKAQERLKKEATLLLDVVKYHLSHDGIRVRT